MSTEKELLIEFVDWFLKIEQPRLIHICRMNGPGHDYVLEDYFRDSPVSKDLLSYIRGRESYWRDKQRDAWSSLSHEDKQAIKMEFPIRVTK